MFDIQIDGRDLQRAGAELGATPRQVQLAIKRASRRTATTLRKMAATDMRDELQLRSIAHIRRRLKIISSKAADGVWFGLNDMPVPRFKGVPAQTSSGASFRGVNYSGAFVAKNKLGERTIFKRKGRARLPVIEQEIHIKDRIDPIIENRLFAGVDAIFWRHFDADLRARVKFQIGQA